MGHDQGTAFWSDWPPSHFNCRSSSGWQGTYTRNPVEIITDPDDMRGVNARRVYPINRSATL